MSTTASNPFRRERTVDHYFAVGENLDASEITRRELEDGCSVSNFIL